MNIKPLSRLESSIFHKFGKVDSQCYINWNTKSQSWFEKTDDPDKVTKLMSGTLKSPIKG